MTTMTTKMISECGRSKMTRRLRRLSFVWAASVAAMVMGASSAVAQEEQYVVDNGSGGGARVTFVTNGDYFLVEDTKCDSSQVYVRWDRTYPDWSDYYEYNGNGCGSTKRFDHNFPEDSQIYFLACRSDWGEDTCSGAKLAYPDGERYDD